MNWSTKRFGFFKELLISLLHTCAFPGCCFLQRKYVTQDHVYGAPKETHAYIPFILCHLYSLTKETT